jgi:hypothetical protein
MQQHDESRWNHKWSALALAALLTLFLAFGQYRGGGGAKPPPAAPAAAPVKSTALARPRPAAKRRAAPVAASSESAHGARLREKGEALGGGFEEREEAAAERSDR